VPHRGKSIFSQVTAHHPGWRSYAESMPTACDTGTGGLYAARHVPAVYYPVILSGGGGRDGAEAAKPLWQSVQ
jgi:hypothetical protein